MVCLDTTIIISVAFVLIGFYIDSVHNVPIIHQYTQSFNSKLGPVSDTIGSELPYLPHQRRLVASLIPAGDLTSPTDTTRSLHKLPTLATSRNNEKNTPPVRGKPISSQHPKRHEDGGKHGARNSNSKLLAKLTDQQISLGDANRNTADAVQTSSNTTKPMIGNINNSSYNRKTDKSFPLGTRTGKELVNTQFKLLSSSPKPKENTSPPSLNPNEGILHLSHKFAELFPKGLIAALNAQTTGGVRSSRNGHTLRITPGQVVQKIPSDKSSEEDENEAVSNVQKIERKPSTEDSDETVIEVYRIEDDVDRTKQDVDRILDELNRSLNLDEILGGNKVKTVIPSKDGIKRSNGQSGRDDFLVTKLLVPIGDDDLQEKMSNDMIVEKLEDEMLELDEDMKSNETETDAKDGVDNEDTESIMHKLRHTDVFAIIYLGGFIGLVTFFFILACSEIFCQNCLYRSSSNLFLPQAHCTHSYYTTPKPVTPPPPYHLFAPPPYMDIAKAFSNVNQSGKTVSQTILHIEATDKASTNRTPCACPGTPCPPYTMERTGAPQGSHISPLVSIISMEDQPCPPYHGLPVSLHKTTNNVSAHVENERDKTGFQQYETVKRSGEAMYEVHRIPSKPILCPCKYDGTTDTIIKSSPNTGDHMVRHCVSFCEYNDNRQVNTYTFKNSVSFSEQTGLTSSTESKMNEIDNRLALANFLRDNLQFKNQLRTRIRNSLSFTSNHSVELEDPGVKHSVSYADHMDNACRTPDELTDRGHLGKQHCKSCFAISSLHSSIPEFGSMSVDKPLVDLSNVHSHKRHQRTETGDDILSNNVRPQRTEKSVDIRNQSNTLNNEALTDNLLNTSLMTPDKDTRTTEQTNIRQDDSNLFKQKTNLDMNKTRDVSTNTCQGYINQMDSIAEQTNTFVNQMESERKVMNFNKTEKQTDFMTETKADIKDSNRVETENTSLDNHNTSIDMLTLKMKSTESTESPLESYNTTLNTSRIDRPLIDHNTSVDDSHMKDSQSQSPHMNSYNLVNNIKESNNSHMNSGVGHCSLTSADKYSGTSPGTSIGKIQDQLAHANTGIAIGKTEHSEDRNNSIGITSNENKGSAHGKNLRTKIFFIDDLDDENFS